MDHVIVTSSWVKSVAYDAPTQTLEVKTKSDTYRYTPVDQDQYDAIVDPANSAGSLINGLKAAVNAGTVSSERVMEVA